MRWVEPGRGRHPGMTPPYVEDTALRVSPDGEILEEISVLDALYHSPFRHLLWRHEATDGDVTHLNDVEPLEAAMAGAFPRFRAGDLLVSVKHSSAVFVMSPATGEIKWLDGHHFAQQHDPDFHPDGTLTVFDNQAIESDAGKHLKSRIVSIDPTVDRFDILYGDRPDEPFYTYAGGKHQKLANGNILITEARAARVFEINPAREIVWQWVHTPYAPDLVAAVQEGTRYDIDAEQVSSWPCSDAVKLAADELAR
jgi:hypothetical protein